MFNLFLYGALTVQFCMSYACRLLEVLPIFCRPVLYIFPPWSAAIENGCIPCLPDRDGLYYFTIIWSGTYHIRSAHREWFFIFDNHPSMWSNRCVTTYSQLRIYWTFVAAFLTQAMYAHRIRALRKLKYISWCIVVIRRPEIVLRSPSTSPLR